MPLTNEARARALTALFGSGIFWLGLASRIDGRDQISVREESDPNYRRQPVTFTGPELVDGGVEVRNAEIVRFPPYRQDARGGLFWFISDSERGGTIAAWDRVLTPKGKPMPPPELGTEVTFHPGTLVIDLGGAP